MEIEFDIEDPKIINVDPQKDVTSLDDPAKNEPAKDTDPVVPTTQPDNVDDNGSGSGNNDGNDNGNDDDTDVPFYISVLEKSGLEFTEEELSQFQDKEDTPETLQETIDFLVNKRLEQERLNLFGEFKEVEELYATLKTGGSFEQFIENKQKAFDFNTIELKNDDVFTQRQVAREYLKLKNVEDDVIDEMINSQEKAGTLYDFSKKALQSVKNHYNELASVSKKELERIQQEQLQAYQQEVQKAQEIAKTGKLAGYTIPKQEAEGLVNYVYAIDKDGKTQYEKDAAALSQEQILAIAYIVQQKLDLSKLIGTQLKTEKAKSIRDMLKNTKPGQRNNNFGKTKIEIPSFESLDIS